MFETNVLKKRLGMKYSFLVFEFEYCSQYPYFGSRVYCPVLRGFKRGRYYCPFQISYLRYLFPAYD